MQVPQEPPQPSAPHCLLAQSGKHVDASAHPPATHACPEPQLPQLPPQPSGPHDFPEQSGVQKH